MVAGHIRLGGQDLPQQANCTFSTLPKTGIHFYMSGQESFPARFVFVLRQVLHCKAVCDLMLNTYIGRVTSYNPLKRIKT